MLRNVGAAAGIVDENIAEERLRVPSEKFRDKLHTTIEEYVTCMTKLLGDHVPSRDAVKTRFVETVGERLGLEPESSTASVSELTAIEAETEMLASAAWTDRVGRKVNGPGIKISAGLHLLEGTYKAPGGLIRAQILARDGRIAELEISGDFCSFPPSGVDALARRLSGLPLDDDALRQAAEAAIGDLGLAMPGVEPADFAAAITAARRAILG